jgi:hypothetical protein
MVAIHKRNNGKRANPVKAEPTVNGIVSFRLGRPLSFE